MEEGKKNVTIDILAIGLSACSYTEILFKVITAVEAAGGEVDDGTRQFNFTIGGLSLKDAEQVFHLLLDLIQRAGGKYAGGMYEDAFADENDEVEARWEAFLNSRSEDQEAE